MYGKLATEKHALPSATTQQEERNQKQGGASRTNGLHHVAKGIPYGLLPVRIAEVADVPELCPRLHSSVGAKDTRGPGDERVHHLELRMQLDDLCEASRGGMGAHITHCSDNHRRRAHLGCGGERELFAPLPAKIKQREGVSRLQMEGSIEVGSHSRQPAALVVVGCRGLKTSNHCRMDDACTTRYVRGGAGEA